MTHPSPIDRRSFVTSVAAAGGALALGFEIPFGPQPVHATDGAPEITAWIVIRPDDTVIIRVAKSEMGQGSFTGLAMLVAEELECDWEQGAAPNSRRRTRTSRATAPGATCRPAAAARSAHRTTCCARPARPRAKC